MGVNHVYMHVSERGPWPEALDVCLIHMDCTQPNNYNFYYIQAAAINTQGSKYYVCYIRTYYQVSKHAIRLGVC